MTEIKSITFTVSGRPQPRGSKQAMPIPKRGGGFVTRANGFPVLTVRDDNPHSREWMRAVAEAAHDAWGDALIAGPVTVSVAFHFARPKCHYGSGRNAGIIKSSAPKTHTNKPDVDKLLRAILDGCTGQVWRDDSQVVGFDVVDKRWTTENEKAVVTITILDQ